MDTQIREQIGSTRSQVDLQSLIELATNGLEQLFDSSANLFAFQYQGHLRRQMAPTSSIQYTTICLLGLEKARRAGISVNAIDTGQVMESVVDQSYKVQRRGHLGMTLWADSLLDGKHSRKLIDNIDAWARLSTLGEIDTMELAWLLTGLSYSQPSSGYLNRAKALARLVYGVLESRFDTSSKLFVHNSSGGGPLSRIRDATANFADQIYSVYALAAFAEDTGRSEALNISLECARKLCELQGRNGQWWWHYNSRHGVIASRYPVFAVHQDGMAPMALLKLSSLTGEDYSGSINRGLKWLFGSNEISASLVSWDRNVIYRGVQQKFPVSYIRYLFISLAHMGFAHAAQSLERLPVYRINHEMRPYHLGWLLYGLSNNTNLLTSEEH